MMLILSLVLALIPLLGIVYTIMSGALATVDSLFLILILLTISGVFLLNAVLEARQRGLLQFRKKTAAAPAPAAQKQAVGQKTT
jgi:hypothetical protein